jgi:hypothetical protein
MSLRSRIRHWLGIDSLERAHYRHLGDTAIRLTALDDQIAELVKQRERELLAPVSSPREAIPDGIESSIQARFGWNPVGAHLTRSAVLRHLRSGLDPVDVMRELDSVGEVIE